MKNACWEEASFLRNSLAFNHPLKTSNDSISNFIKTSPDSSHLKDAKTGKYLLKNKSETVLSGIEPSDFVGLTADDIEMSFLQGSKATLVKTIKEIDERVRVDKCPLLLKEIFLTHDGFIRVQNLMECLLWIMTTKLQLFLPIAMI